MEKFTAKPINYNNINGGFKYASGDVIQASALNEIVQGISAKQDTSAGSNGAASRTVLWEGAVSDYVMKQYFNAGNDYYFLEIQNAPQTIKEDSYLIYEFIIGTLVEGAYLYIKKPILTMNNVSGSVIGTLHMVAGADTQWSSISFDEGSNNTAITLFSSDDFSTTIMAVGDDIRLIPSQYTNYFAFSPASTLGGNKSGSGFSKAIRADGGMSNLIVELEAFNPASKSYEDRQIILTKIVLVEA